MRFGVGLAALAATEPAKAIAMLSEAGTTRIAIRAIHSDLRFGFRSHDLSIHEALRVFER